MGGAGAEGRQEKDDEGCGGACRGVDGFHGPGETETAGPHGEGEGEESRTPGFPDGRWPQQISESPFPVSPCRTPNHAPHFTGS